MNLRSFYKKSWIYEHIGFHYLIIVAVALAAVFSIILLAGAGSNSLGASVFLVQFGYSTPEATQNDYFGPWENITRSALKLSSQSKLRIRVGYFGVCGSGDDQGQWICKGSVSSLMATRRFTDPLGIAKMAEDAKSEVFFPGLLLASTGLAFIAVILLIRYPGWQAGWQEEIKEDTGSDVSTKIEPYPFNNLILSCLSATALGAIFTLTSALWQHTAAATAATLLEISAVSAVKASVGNTGMALGWLAFVFWLTSFIMVSMSIWAIILVNKFPDGDLDDTSDSESFFTEV
ncbi:hypothetical protein BS50DRAFT_623427 [Corynespora cassiicola Philippines]|uniref:Membrane fusion mating protein FIG1 n=1 Tax=Corynespora cassiicola Philippines TaxID=1448308 RepID=A0A2T2NEP2_CORCC|nr:hypothetical protein BS50DRAFT_623427 [Corynespora cassiicola Philippines]